MSLISSSLAISESASFLQSELEDENQRKARLIQLFCLVAICLQLGAVASIVISHFITGTGNYRVVPAFLVYFVLVLISYRLASAGRCKRASWLLVGSTTLVTLSINLQSGTALPLHLILVMTIVLASVLLETKGTILVATVCIVFTVSLTIAQDFLRLYTPFVKTDQESISGVNIVLPLIVMPTIVAILLFPARAQARLLQRQNSRLSAALRELEARQEAIEQVSQQVLLLSAELKVTANQQSSGSQEQVANVAQVSSTVQELSNTAAQIAQVAEQVNQSAETMAADIEEIESTSHLSVNQSQDGTVAVQQTVLVCKEVAGLYDQLLQTLSELNNRSLQTRRIMEILSSIASETHLLALNAAIEAAGAGEYGSRFAVVAQEVKSLAARSSQSSQEVVAVIQQIEKAINSAVQVVESGYTKVQEMEKVAGQAGTVIEGMRRVSEQAQKQALSISKVSHDVQQLSSAIKTSTVEQHSASQQVLGALSGLMAVAQQNAAGSLTVTSTVNQLEGMSSRLKIKLNGPAHLEGAIA